MRNWFRNTPGGKAGAIDGLNLFFGALLGANLGTVQGMQLADYVQIVVLLAGSVMVLRMLSTSERRMQMLLTLAAYALLLASVVTIPALQPEGISQADLHRLVATLGIWVLFVLAAELTSERPRPGVDRAD